MKQTKTAWWLQVPVLLDKAVKKAVETGFFSSKSELIRTAVIEKLRREMPNLCRTLLEEEEKESSEVGASEH